MIEIISYLRTTDGQFVEVSETDTRPANHRYVEGAIDLVIDGVPILDVALWDYVDQLCAYISDMVIGLCERRRARLVKFSRRSAQVWVWSPGA